MRNWLGILGGAFLVLTAASGLGAQENVTRAVAVIHSTEGNETWGTVEFTKVDEGVRVVAEVSGLKPNQKHGFHIHEWGDCSDHKARSAGGHYNPEGAPHGGPDDEKRHVGDLGNIEADEEGKGRYERVDSHLKLTGEHSIIGRAVMVHEGEDDLKSQPTGDAGGRIGCGTIGIAEPQG